LFSRMGWGLPDSPGHYLDFVSAVLGCALLIAGMIWISFNARRARRGLGDAPTTASNLVTDKRLD
jgi:hypothetical protein